MHSIFVKLSCYECHFIAENRGIDKPDLFEGDMILTPEQRGYAEMGLDVFASNPQGAAIKSGLWPGGRVVYDIEPALGKVLKMS